MLGFKYDFVEQTTFSKMAGEIWRHLVAYSRVNSLPLGDMEIVLHRGHFSIWFYEMISLSAVPD